MSYLSEFFADKELATEHASNRVLCVLEGNSELALVKKTYELVKGIVIEFEQFLHDVIHLSWGKMPVIWKNKQQGDFQGGRIGEAPMPYPVLESLHNSNIDMYAAVLVMFDADLDAAAEVMTEAHSFTQEYKSFIFYSEPCFEAEMVELTKNERTEAYVSDNYRVIGSSKCRWYKRSWSQIPKKEKFGGIQSVKNIIPILELDDFVDKSQKITGFKSFIGSNFSQA